MTKMLIGLNVKYLLFLPHCNENWIFFKYFRKMLKLIKLRPVGAQLFHPDRRTNGRTDKDEESNSHFSHYCELAKHNDG